MAQFSGQSKKQINNCMPAYRSKAFSAAVAVPAGNVSFGFQMGSLASPGKLMTDKIEYLNISAKRHMLASCPTSVLQWTTMDYCLNLFIYRYLFICIHSQVT